MGTLFLVYPIDGTDLGISADEFETAGRAWLPGCEVIRTPADDSDGGIHVRLRVRDPQGDHGFEIFLGRQGDRISTEGCRVQGIRVALWAAGLTDESVALLDVGRSIATAVPRGGTVEDVESGWTSDIPRPDGGTT